MHAAPLDLPMSIALMIDLKSLFVCHLKIRRSASLGELSKNVDSLKFECTQDARMQLKDI